MKGVDRPSALTGVTIEQAEFAASSRRDIQDSTGRQFRWANILGKRPVSVKKLNNTGVTHRSAPRY